MPKTFAALLCVLLLSFALAACMGDDDDDTETPATDAATPATTQAPAPATPTTSATATPEPAMTATRAAASPTSDDGTPSASPTTGSSGFTDEEAALLDLLLAESDLPGDWTQTRAEVPEESEGPGICDAPRYPRADEKIAEVEVEFQSNDNARVVLQNLTHFPDDVAPDAMQYARESVSCTEWVDDEGTVFTISETDAPDLGDESFAFRVAFEVADAGTLDGDYIFVRVGGYISIVTYLVLDDYDPQAAAEVATIATAKLEQGTTTGSGLTAEEQALVDGLLALDDVPEDWDQLSSAGRSDPDDWTQLCDAELFDDAEAALARVSVGFYQGFAEDSATIQQLLIAYPDDVVEDAMEYERLAMSCASFEQDGSEVQLEPADFAPLGDDLEAVHFTFESDEGDPVDGYWIVVRTGSLLSTIIYSDPLGADPVFAEDLVRDAVAKMDTVVLPA